MYTPTECEIALYKEKFFAQYGVEPEFEMEFESGADFLNYIFNNEKGE